MKLLKLDTFSSDPKIKGVVRIYFSFLILRSFSTSLIAPIAVLFFLYRKLDILQIAVIQLIYMISIFLGEIPTGAFADILGRRVSIALSLCCSFIYFIIHVPQLNPKIFFPAEILSGLAFVFLSGALSAWLVDNLKYHGYKGKLEEVFSRAKIIDSTTRMIGVLVGSYIGSYNLSYPWLVGSIGIFLTLWLIIPRMEELYFTKKKLGVKEGIENIVKTSKVSINYGIKHRKVFLLFIASMLLFFFCWAPNMYWQPRFLSLLGGEKIWVMGYVNVCMYLAIIGGAQLSVFLVKKFKSRFLILIFTVLITSFGIIIAAYSANFFIALFFFLFYEIGLGVRDPVYMSLLHENIPSKERATIISFGSVLNSAGGGIGILILGLIAKNFSISRSWFIAALVLMLSIIPYTILYKEEVPNAKDFKNICL
ncbi:hypothetical protein CVT91_01595 [Candidatus Atribacteria bacterium HGW-Atribacteria-1]|nr:MAG: hypothetical protein CVT91_01595 [Candidatus Atribacteria bacterium HGW-Atribacteria-1]